MIQKLTKKKKEQLFPYFFSSLFSFFIRIQQWHPYCLFVFLFFFIRIKYRYVYKYIHYLHRLMTYYRIKIHTMLVMKDVIEGIHQNDHVCSFLLSVLCSTKRYNRIFFMILSACIYLVLFPPTEIRLSLWERTERTRVTLFFFFLFLLGTNIFWEKRENKRIGIL